MNIAMVSVHTCPLAALGGKETGGMNVYVRETVRELSRMGAHVDVFTRSQNPTIPRVVDMGQGARVIHLPAGPEAPMPREAVHQHLDQFVAGVEAMGLKVVAQYALMGQYDFLNLIEAPDEQTMAKAAVMLAARGTMRTATMPAIPVEDLIARLSE